MFSGLLAGLGGSILAGRDRLRQPDAGHRHRARCDHGGGHRGHELRRRHRHRLGNGRRRPDHRLAEHRPRPPERVAVLPAGRQGRDHRRRDHHRRAQEPLTRSRRSSTAPRPHRTSEGSLTVSDREPATRSCASGRPPTRGASGSRVDPLQTPWQRYLDEVQAAGYRWTELGPFGYLPTDPGVVREEYAKRGLRLTGGTVFVGAPQGQGRARAGEGGRDAEMAVHRPSSARATW